MLLTPEVNSTTEDRPRLWARIPGMRVQESSIRSPHHLLQLPELAQEAGLIIVDLLDIWTNELCVLVLLNVPDRVWTGTLLGTSNFLLLRCPFWEFDLVGEQRAAGHGVDESELGLDGPQVVLAFTLRLLLDDLDAEIVVGITFEASISVSRNLILPLGLCHWWADVVGVKTSLGWNVPELDGVSVLDGGDWHNVVPGEGTVDLLVLGVKWLGDVLKQPDVVLILVWVKSNLLLLGSTWVHKWVRMQVATLSVVVSNADAGSECNIGWSITHGLGVEGGLELRAHESITLTWVNKAEEVDVEHGHVESDWDGDQGKDSGQDVLGVDSWSDVLVIGEQDPELNNGQGADPGDREESNPLDAGSSTKSEAGCGQPEPPAWAEGLAWTLLVLVCERCESQCGQAGHDHEWRIEKDEASLGKKTVLWKFC